VLCLPDAVSQIFYAWQWERVWVIDLAEICTKTQGTICLRNHDNGRSPRTGTLLNDALVKEVTLLILDRIVVI